MSKKLSFIGKDPGKREIDDDFSFLIRIPKVVGKDWFEALLRAVEIREKRAVFYGNRWIDEPVEFDVWMCYGKASRATHFLKKSDVNSLKNKENYEKLEDTLRDLVNYSLFALAKIEKRRDEQRKKKSKIDSKV